MKQDKKELQSIGTVGELREYLEGIEDDMPLLDPPNEEIGFQLAIAEIEGSDGIEGLMILDNETGDQLTCLKDQGFWSECDGVLQ